MSRRFIALFSLLLLVVVPARADVATQMQAFIPAEDYKAAKALGVPALADPRQHEAVLALLFNLVLESPADFSEEEWKPWEQELRSQRSAVDAKARSLATLATWQAQRAWQARNRDEANAAVAEALDLLEKGKGEIAPVERAYVLAVAGQITGLQGDYARGAELATQAAELLARPRNLLEKARRLRALFFQALFEDRLGHYEVAVATARKGIAEADTLEVPNNGFRRRLVGVLSETLISRGEFAQVRDLMRPELERLRANPNASPRDLAMTLGHLAEAERQLGDRERGLNLYRESAAAAAKDPGLVASGSYAAILGNLGALAYEMQRYEEADSALGQNLALLEQQFGSDSPRIVGPLINAGELAYERNLLDESEARFRRALAIVSTKLNPQHVDGAPALRGLGRVLLRRGDAKDAAAMIAGALAQQEAAAGTEHPQLLAWRCDLARAQYDDGDRTAAQASALLVERRRNDLVAAVTPVLGETQALEFKRNLGRCSELLLAATAGGNAAQTAAVWDEIATARGLATRIAGQRLAWARQNLQGEEKQRWERWSKAAADYADALRGGADAATLAGLRRDVDAAIEALGDTERLLPPQRAATAQLVAALPAQTTLVAYAAGAGEGIKPHLYAFVAAAGKPPQLRDLGLLEALDARAERWYRLMREPGHDAELRSAGQAVREHFFDALQLGDPAARVFVVADAGVHRLNFAALPDGDGYLVERGLRLHLLETEHDLAAANVTSRRSLLLLGVPQLARAEAAELGRLRGSCPELDVALQALPGAEREIDALANVSRAAGLDQITALKGSAATASALRKGAPQSGIIHFATHAFEIGAACAQQAGAVRRGVGLRRDNAGAATSAREALAREAGLVLSGERGNNGLLLGADVSTLALDGVGWVVLSACDTGLGARLQDEGVFGLRRAFRLAGARTVVMSLWPVEDAATSAWMESLYRSRLQQGADTVDAVASAGLAVLKARREKGESVHPFYWAGFVAVGDWR